MIGYIKGKIISKGERTLVVDVKGVGYEVFVAEEVLEEAEEGEEAEFFVWTYLRQDTLELYGCSGREELDFFKFLNKVSGIGPKIALSLARFGSPSSLKEQIEKKGAGFSRQIKGLGKKKMRRLLLELTGKVKELKKGKVSERAEAVKGLTSLGFSKSQAEKAVLEVDGEIKDTEKVVKRALNILGDAEKD